MSFTSFPTRRVRGAILLTNTLDLEVTWRDTCQIAQRLIRDFGFPSSDITVILTGGLPSQPKLPQGVVLKRFVRGSKNDYLNLIHGSMKSIYMKGQCDIYFHLGSHGGNVVERVKTAGNDRTGRSSFIVIPDTTGDRIPEVITDNDFFGIVSKLPESVNMLAAIDTCHSGTMLNLPWTNGIRENNLKVSASVICIGACADHQQEANAFGNGFGYGGLLSISMWDNGYKGPFNLPSMISRLKTQLNAFGQDVTVTTSTKALYDGLGMRSSTSRGTARSTSTRSTSSTSETTRNCLTIFFILLVLILALFLSHRGGWW